MLNSCFNCGSSDFKITYDEHRTEDNLDYYKGIQFHDIILHCPDCGYTYNCIGANKQLQSKAINSSVLPI